MTLAEDAIARAGLAELVARRVRGEAPSDDELARASAADLLALGAAADRVRHADVGDEVRIHVHGAPSDPAVLVVGEGEPRRGTELLRHLALTRLRVPARARLCLDFGAVGLEIAQVALAFGVSELCGPLATKRGLALLEKSQALTKRGELAGYVTRAQRTPVFVDARAATAAKPETSASATAEPRLAADRSVENPQ